MTKPLPIRYIAALLIVAIFTFVFIHRHVTRIQVQKDLEEQAQVVAPSLWNLTPKQSQKYLNVVAEQYQYHSLIIKEGTEEIFSQAHSSPSSPIDIFFNAAGLFPVTNFSQKIIFNEQPIGTVIVDWYDQSIYTYLYVLVVGLLFLSILQLYNRLILANQGLEKTVRRRTDKLQQSEAKFKAILDNHYQLTGLLSPDGILLSANPASLALIRETQEDIIGLSFCDCPWWSKNDTLKEKIKTAVKEAQQGKFVRLEVDYLGDNDRKYIIDLSLKPVFNDSGELIYIVPEGRDITELKESQQETLKEKLFTDAVIKSLPGIFYIYDEQFKLIRWNKNHETETGYTAQELSGKNILSRFTPEERDKVRTSLQGYTTNNPSLTIELNPINKDGSSRPYLYSGTMVNIEGKHYILGTAFDISDRKQIEEKLQQALKMEAIGTLAGGIAHDFNNILAAILGYTELSQILKKEKNGKLSDYLTNIHASALRARDLVQQILTFSRKGDQERVALQVSPLVKETLKMLRSTIPANIIITEDLDAEDAIILANPTQFHQVLMNLCTNGYQAIGTGSGTISVTLTTEVYTLPGASPACGNHSDTLHLQIADDGCGMDSKTLEKIFDPYFTTKEVHKGTGLGLSLVHGIIESHSGEIQAKSTPGKGTVFDIYLPLSTETASTNVPRPQQIQPVDAEYHLLCVDDEPHIQNIFREYLAGLGYEVTCLSDPGAALKELQQHPKKFNLLITDMTMPTMTGVQLARQALTLNPVLPIILCTGYSTEIDREKALALGIRDYIEKPVDLTRLSRSVAEALGDEATDNI